ncbi:hypothetical protein AM24_166 [Acinetobacter phage AM24]|nr:hypothetical protein AM24_166 [Acinetobacter phage AM24]
MPSVDFESLFSLSSEDRPVGYRTKDVKIIISVPQKEKVIFKGWDMSRRDGVWRKIPVGTVFKVMHVTKDGKFLGCTNPDYTLSDIVFYNTEVEYAMIPVELVGMEV